MALQEIKIIVMLLLKRVSIIVFLLIKRVSILESIYHEVRYLGNYNRHYTNEQCITVIL